VVDPSRLLATVLAVGLFAGCGGAGARVVEHRSKPSPTPSHGVSSTRRGLIYRLRGVRDAAEVVAVISAGWHTTHARLTLWRKEHTGRWLRVAGPWPARIGYDGFSAHKHEGDGTTPAGSYRFGFGFGVRRNPGYRGGWLLARPGDVWVDDPTSRYYNLPERGPPDGRWRSAESLYQPAPYAYAVTIEYNVDPIRPGRGSAIFLHVGTGTPTAGCVSLPEPRLLAVLRWLDPASRPRIVMGPLGYLTGAPGG
jgi:L,D-peptidoglycan transpeptidase YkuD (ErfK/YbiS/YcfS/YnhG family)